MELTDRSKHDDPLAGLLARTLAAGLDSSGTECPPPEMLAAFFDRSLPEQESVGLEPHVSSCGRCQEQLAAMAHMEMASAPAVQTVTSRPWVWNLRWLMPAAAALGAVALWVVLRVPESPNHSSGEQAQIAEHREAPATREATRPAAPEQPPAETSHATKSPASLADTIAQAPSRQTQGQVGADQAASRAKASSESIGRSSKLSADRSFAGAMAPPAAPQGATYAEGQNAKPSLADQRQAPTLQAAEKGKAEEAQSANKVAVLGTLKSESAQSKQDNFRQDKDAPQTQTAGARAAEVQSQVPGDELKKDGLKGKDQTAQVAEAAAAPSVPSKESRDQAGFELRTRRMNELDSRYVTVPVLGAQALWRVGPEGTIEKSLDAGRTWLKQTSGVTADLLAGSAPTAKVCWIAGRGGVVLRTTDGGTWTQGGSPTSLDLVAIEALDASRAVVTTSEGKRYATTDGGRTWHSL